MGKANRLKVGFTITGVLATGMLFQNCGKPYGFNYTQDNLLSSAAAFSIKDSYLSAELNTPVTKNLSYTGDASRLNVSFENGRGKNVLSIPEGTFEILDSKTLLVRFTPAVGFRGQVNVPIYVYDRYNNMTQAQLRASVDNPLQKFKPALAIRGGTCISCHANVAAPFITDFGYNGDRKGNDFFLKNRGIHAPGYIRGYYPLHEGGGLLTLNLHDGGSLIVPKTDLPQGFLSAAFPELNGKLTTIKEMVVDFFSRNQYPTTKSAEVKEVAEVFISSPTSQVIADSFQAKSTETIKFFPETNKSAPFSGLVENTDYFKNSGPLVCDGDLYLSKPVLFTDLKVSTQSGCRVYVTGMVLIYGGIQYLNETELSNLQIMSSNFIGLGMGAVKKDGQYCDTQGWYSQNEAGYWPSVQGDSFLNRVDFHGKVYSESTTQEPDPEVGSNKLVAEYKRVLAGESAPLYDAECRPEGRGQAFKKLLLNAPRVHNRYNGDVTGVVIAETALFSLGAFKYRFDPVFEKVPILPMVNHKNFFDIAE